MENETIKNIITIGTSAGGISAVSRLVSTFHEDLDAAVFIVIHVSPDSMTDVILNTIQKNTLMECRVPGDQDLIQNRKIYLAPSDHHMLLERGTIRITKGAYENHWRPSIDVLFRSAAATYNSCVTGIILTGLLDDGTSGMFAIKRSGGRCMIQQPEEADFPDMPNNVLNNMEVDYSVSINEMGHILSDLFSRSVCEETLVPEDVRLEAEIARRMSSNVEDLKKLGELTSLTCPDCGGVLAQIADDVIPRYRCYTGHTFTEKSLEEEQLKGIEDSLWVAIRMLEERKNLLKTLKGHQQKQYNGNQEQQVQQRSDEIQVHINRLKMMLMDVGEANQQPSSN
ncbi:two-component system, chemotaxis family, response regulator CheB [Pedobacter westerhofensis]|uniref:protein-glutamate methylesterase n=1 Tax=Pedobacter westerhofensis TaxID=425512 RepID=A0A521FJT0_9SPHI|nr:chemotaxis protein CheB [Pedobacter westerhofensis]SMO96376.1 two-component system, chemotaxis family, response regulator CheB [Pedobacter westerhofensis]